MNEPEIWRLDDGRVIVTSPQRCAVMDRAVAKYAKAMQRLADK